MIQLHPDYLLFATGDGDAIPCSAELVAVELIGESASELDPQVIRHAAAAVLHYFKHDLGRSFVSVGEFSQALEKVLKGFGFSVVTEEDPEESFAVADLGVLAEDSGKAFELAFFPKLRAVLRRSLETSPECVRFDGLRDCVKQLTGAKRWNSRCEALSDRIVAFVRRCLETEAESSSCRVVIR